VGPTIVVLVRHAATDANLRQPPVLQGVRVDPGLCPLGRRQAAALGEALALLPINAVCSSRLLRAQQTAAQVAIRHCLPVDLVDELGEVDVGTWEGQSWDEIERRWPSEYRQFLEAPDHFGYLGGENLLQVLERSAPAIGRLTQRHPAQTIVVVGHNTVNRVLLSHWLGLPLAYTRKIPQTNAGFNIVACGRGSVTVRTINVVAHLAGLVPDE
jgi:broad specificity phosphatase PhoE